MLLWLVSGCCDPNFVKNGQTLQEKKQEKIEMVGNPIKKWIWASIDCR